MLYAERGRRGASGSFFLSGQLLLVFFFVARAALGPGGVPHWLPERYLDGRVSSAPNSPFPLSFALLGESDTSLGLGVARSDEVASSDTVLFKDDFAAQSRASSVARAVLGTECAVAVSAIFATSRPNMLLQNRDMVKTQKKLRCEVRIVKPPNDHA